MLLILVWLLPFAGAGCCGLIKKDRNREWFAAAISLLVLLVSAAMTVVLPDSVRIRIMLPLGIGFRADGFRLIYCMVTAYMWLTSSTFCPEYFAAYQHRAQYQIFSLLTFGAVIGVFLAEDLLTLFVFFEIMSIASWVMVIHDQKEKTRQAAGVYLTVAIIGGLSLLMGLAILNHELGTLVISELFNAVSAHGFTSATAAAAGLLLIGFGSKAGVFPLHIWLPQAHPAAPAPASALLSGVMTKTGVLGITVIFCELLRDHAMWSGVLLVLAAVTMLVGAVLALFSVNLKRTLACSSISQMGFILTGIAMQGFLGSHNALAVWGAILHMLNHSVIKLVLFCCAGDLYLSAHSLNLNELHGCGRGKPLLTGLFAAGALSIAGVPGLSGYISKTLLHESIVEQIAATTGEVQWCFRLAEWVFLITGGITAAYMTKLFVAIFVEKPVYPHTHGMGRQMNLVTAGLLTLPCLLMVAGGVFPGAMERIAVFGQEMMHGYMPDHGIHYFAITNLKGAMISLSLGAVLYFGVVRTALMSRPQQETRQYLERWPSWLDIGKNIYHPLLMKVFPEIGHRMCKVLDRVEDWLFKPAFAGKTGRAVPFARLAALLRTGHRKD